jgi:hypothetical protein
MVGFTPKVKQLVRRLDAPKASARYSACEELRVIPELPSEALEALRRAMSDPDASVADAARRAVEVHAAPRVTRRPLASTTSGAQGGRQTPHGTTCPRCGSVAGKAILRCKACGEVYDRADFETYQHLDFLVTWLGEHASLTGKPFFEQLQSVASREREGALAALRPAGGAPPEPQMPPVVAVEAPVTTASVVAPVPVAPVVKKETPAVVPLAEKPRPPRPKFSWAKWWEKTWNIIVSGALLRALLYLGALMIVVSAAVLVVRFWDIFPQVMQLVFIAAVPTAFYLAGWLVRTRLKLPQAGGVLAAIGALLLAVDFAAVYQFGGLADTLDATAYWLGASLACTAVYVLSAWRLPTEAFGYITLFGFASTMFAFTRLIRLPLEGQIAMVSTMGPAMIWGAKRLIRATDRWLQLRRAGQRLAHLWLVAWPILVVFVPGHAALGQAVTFLITSLGFGLLAWSSPRKVYAQASVWTTVGACVFLLLASALDVEWYPLVGGALSIVYSLAGHGLGRPSGGIPAEAARFSGPLDLASWVLLGAGILGGVAALFFDLWAGVAALTLGALTLCWQARLRSIPALVLLGGTLFTVPFSLAVLRILGDLGVAQPGTWLTTALAGLAMVYLSLGVALGRAPRYAGWLYLLTHALTVSMLFGGLFGWLLSWSGGSVVTELASLGGAILIYAASAVLHDSGRRAELSGLLNRLPASIGRNAFQWPLGVLVPIWMATAWSGTVLSKDWLGAAMGVLALAYVGMGVLLSRRRREYRWPPDLYAHGLAAAGILIAFGDRWALVITLYLAVAVLAALALVRRWPVQAALASVLGVWPFGLSLELSPLLPHAYSLALALLASAVFSPLGALLGKAGRRYSVPQYVIGYAVAALAVVLSVLGRFGFYAIDVPWIGVATPLLITALLVDGASRFGTAFAWATAGVFAVAWGQALTLFHVPGPCLATAWVGFALIFMVAERALAHRPVGQSERWHRGFRLPLTLGAIASAVVALGLTVPDTAAAFADPNAAPRFAAILAQSLVVLICILSARLYRTRWLLYPAAVLSFFPYTLAWIGYWPGFTPPEMAWPWTGLSAVLLAGGFALDRTKERYGHAPYLVGYLLGLLAIGWSALERRANIYTLAAWMVLLIVSHVVVHIGRHQSFEDLVNRIWRDRTTVACRAAGMLFLWAAAIIFPIWLVQLLTYNAVPLAWRGLALALAAPLYVALGLGLGRVRRDYTWPLYGVGYALTAIGAMVAFEDEALALYVLGIDALIYAISAYLFRQGAWLYLSNALVPVIALITLHYNDALSARWVGPIFMGLAFVYFVIGQIFDRRRQTASEGISPFAMPCYAVGYLLSAVALAVASSERDLALAIYSAAVVLYALAAWCFREPLFLYPAVWLAAVPYYLAMTLTRLPPNAYGLGWLPLIAVTLAIGRIAFHKRPLGTESVRTLPRALLHPAMPFYLLAYGLSVSMVVQSRNNAGDLTLALTTAAVLYFGSAALFRRPAWLFPGLLAAHGALGAFLALHPTGRPIAYASLPFLALTCAVALTGELFAWRFPIAPPRVPKDGGLKLLGRRVSLGRWPFVESLGQTSWAQPFGIFLVMDVILWQALAQSDAKVSVVVACGLAVLLALLATRWRDPILAHASLAFAAVEAADGVRWADLAFPNGLAWLAGMGFVLYLLGRILELPLYQGRQWASPLAVWPRPLTHFSVLLTALPVLGTLPSVTTHSVAFIASLAFCGALYLAIAYRGRYARLGYLGLAMLELAWILALFNRGIRQPQLYAIPAGLYFIGVGTLELRLGRRLFGGLLEAFGLCVLVITAFIQSLQGAAGFPYFVLLLAEGLAIIWWGAGQQRKVPFIIGLAASVLNVIAQVIVLVNVYQVERWVIVLGAGLLLVSLAVFVERKREQIIARAREWRDTLETWG